ncbi:PREDICTED: uncharacterized protein LOC104806269 isoform X2 [Tarenaya hassleriana]|uniref:uncharacterized protein LOC104806269 isoform X2 n=1 Tax=Tarenaya hassleriana TaxID=28532 RepID=UPI00053C440D|nr:PREDICTED: uncharacterized protein LOC104806269 isoform X2 [Tarenaya hassleriana]
MPETEAVPDDLRCNRSDGRKWRCKRRAMEGRKMCEIHHLQLNLRQHKQKVPESLKLVRSKNVAEASGTELTSGIRARRSGKSGKASKRKRVMGEAEAVDEAVRKMKLKRGDARLDLIRMVLKREVEKMKKPNKKKKMNKKESNREFDDSEGSDEDLMRFLPYGVMAISSSSPNTSNAASSCDVKVGAEPISVSRRRFRSKNIEPFPVGKMQVVPFKENLVNARKEKKKRCHWCGRNGFGNLICCLNCKREFFCLDCIGKRNAGSRKEVERECPICRGSCGCKACSVTMSGVTQCKDVLITRSEIDRVLHLHYLICMLLPVLKQINAEHKTELEREAEMKGRNPAELHIQSSDERHHCSYCNAAIAGLHGGCHCDKDQNQGSSPIKTRSIILKCSNDRLPALLIARNQSPKERPRDCELGHSSSEELLRHESPDVSGELSCIDREASGFGNDLRTLTMKLETSAEEIVSCYELPEILDKSSGCSFCRGTEEESGKVKHLKEAARREDMSGNFLYYPIMTDFNNNSLEHFQTHWSQGQPVIVQNVIKGAYDLDWDPVAMFCAYLQNSNSNSQNDEADKTSDCSDWFEIDIGVRQLFLGSLRGRAETNTCQEKLKLQGRVPSRLFEEQFPAHYAEVLNILPIPHYMDPECGLLNIAAKLPFEIQTPDLGPCLNIYYRSGEEFVQPDSLKKLGFELCDKVDILLHVTEAWVSTKEICRIRKLMKRKNAQDEVMNKERDASKMVNDNMISIDKLGSDKYGENSKSRIQRAKKQSGFATERCDLGHKDREASYSGDDQSDYHSGSDSEYEDRQIQGPRRENGNNSCEEDLGSSYGVQWDIFRRQDVPKLMEYLKKHSHKKVSHPPLDRSYYLDAYHKKQLREEFEIEPWTFDQHVGEAVIIPAGCPYQIRKVKSCVNVELNFVSPEHVNASIRRAEEQCLLQHHHKAKGPEIEVKKMAIHKISEAIKEIRQLTSSSDSTTSSK